MSNCVVGSGGSGLPCSIIAEHSVDHFSHYGDDDHLGFLVGVGRPREISKLSSASDFLSSGRRARRARAAGATLIVDASLIDTIVERLGEAIDAATARIS